MTSIHDELMSAVGSARGTIAADRLCEACVDLLAVDAVAMSIVFDGTSSGTFGASGKQARTYDELQFVLGEGPCLESVHTRAPVLVRDLRAIDTARWSAYAPAMLAYDVCGVFAMPVVVAGEYLGALDLFRHRPGVLNGDDLAGALVAAELAELPLLDLLTEDLRDGLVDPDNIAWDELTSMTRAEVAQATGMLVAQLQITPAEALVRLRAHAYATGRSATDVARDILDRTLRLEAD